MAIAADLFHVADAARETLHKRITPTDDQFEDQKTRWNDLAAFLRTRLKAETGLGTRTWLQGSYKFDTQIRPWMIGAEFDIDLGFYFEWGGTPEQGKYTPDALKAWTQTALEDYQSCVDAPMNASIFWHDRACDQVQSCVRPRSCGLSNAAGPYGDMQIGSSSDTRARWHIVRNDGFPNLVS